MQRSGKDFQQEKHFLLYCSLLYTIRVQLLKALLWEMGTCKERQWVERIFSSMASIQSINKVLASCPMGKEEGCVIASNEDVKYHLWGHWTKQMSKE